MITDNASEAASPQERVLSSNPVLEAFGNAKTVRNNNSSRFAKMIDILFNKNGYIVGGRIKKYLLEKSRVVTQSAGERNFHSFYYLLSGCDKTERAVWGLSEAKNYKYTNQSKIYDIADINPKLEYVGLKRAMTVGGISVHEQHLIFTLLSAILHLGNVRFNKGDEASVKNMEIVKWVAHLLKCDHEALSRALVTGETEVGGELIEVPLSTQKAEVMRDTIAKEIYGRTFDWIVTRLNEDMQTDDFSTKISLLDIFGFEHYETNRFEQLCINYANERLQYVFNDFIFRKEKEEYLAEKIDVSDFTYVDNSAVLTLIEDKTIGILAVVDEECNKSGGGKDSALLRVIKASKRYVKSENGSDSEPNVFAVSHYAGEVVYDIRGFVATNREHFSKEVLTAIRSSSVDLFRRLFSEVKIGEDEAEAVHNAVGTQFRDSLVTLLDDLSASTPQYVRCIRPNSTKSAGSYDRWKVLRQIRATGVLDTIRIRKEGFPYRREMQAFLNKYSPILPIKHGVKSKDPLKKQCKYFFKAMEVPEDQYRLGTTKVFTKDEANHRLEGLLFSYYNDAAIAIQTRMKGFVTRRKYKRKLEASKLLQVWFRKYLVAVDCSVEVGAHLKSIREGEGDVYGAVTSIGALASRKANIDTIVEQGGVDSLVQMLDDEKSDSRLIAASSDTLGTMAQGEHSVQIARKGGVRSTVKNINLRTNVNEQPHSIALLGNLSEDQRNVGIVIREGGIEALTAALRRNSNVDVVTDSQASAAAHALGNISRDRRASRAMGRDDQAIKAIIDGINQKPMYARLTQYSINTLGNMAQTKENVDSIVEHGGIVTLVAAMNNHPNNDLIWTEIARSFTSVAKNPMYAKMIGDQGAMQYALEALKRDPQHLGPPASEIIQSICSHPANTTKFIKANGVALFLEILSSELMNETVCTIVTRLLSVICQDVSHAEYVTELNGPNVLLDSMCRRREMADHAINVMSCLMSLSQHQKHTFDHLKAEFVVQKVSQTMEVHAENPEVIEIGVQILRLLSDQADLEKAMDFVARSRMKNQTNTLLMETGINAMVVGSLALLDGNIEYIVAEGGIPVLLNIVNGTSVKVSLRIADQVLVPSIRALGRLMTDDSNVEEFITEGGVTSLVASLNDQSDKVRVCSVCTWVYGRLIETNGGWKELVNQGGLEAIIKMLGARIEHETVVLSVMGLLTQIAKTKSSGASLLLSKKILSVITKVLKNYKNNTDVYVATCGLLELLTKKKDQGDRRKLFGCADLILAALKNDPENPKLAAAALRFLAKLARDSKGVAYLKEKDVSAVLVTLITSNPDEVEVSTSASQILSQITGNAEIMKALEKLKAQTHGLKNDPANLVLMDDMLRPVTLIGSMSNSEKAATEIVDADGFKILTTALLVTEKARECAQQEILLKQLASAITKLANHRKHTKKMLISGTVDHLLSAVTHYVDYEDFVEETQAALDVLSRNPEATAYLIDIGSHRSVAEMVQAHPLNDQVLVSSTRYVTRLAKGADKHNLAPVRKEGADLAMVAVGRFMNTEDHLIDALSSVSQIASLNHDGSHLAVPQESITMFKEVVRRHKNSPSVMTAASSAFQALADDHEFASKFVEEGLIDAILVGLESYGDNEDFVVKALGVIHKLALVEENVPILAEKGVPGLVMDVMRRHVKSEQVQHISILVMKELAVLVEIGEDLCEHGGVRMSFNAVRNHPLAPHIVTGAMAFAHVLALHKGNHNTLKSERAIEMIKWSMRAYPHNAALQDECHRVLKLLIRSEEEMAEIEAKTQVDMPQMDDSGDRDSQAIMKQLISIMKIIKNPESNRKQLAVALMGLANSKASKESLYEMVKHGGMNRLVTILDEATEDTALLLPVMKCLIRFADESEHINLIVAYGGIGALIRSMIFHMSVPDVLAVGLKLLGKFSVFNRLKVLIGLHGGIPMILEIMERYLSIAPLLNKGCYCLGNLASNCLPNRRAILKGGGVNLVSFAMQKHRSYLELVINAARALSPLCADDDTARLTVAKGGGSLIVVRAILHNPKNPALLQNGLNCLHKISKRAETLPTLIHQGAVQAVVASMTAYPANTELQQFGMEILSNLSSFRSRETAQQLTKGGTIEAVVTSALNHHNRNKIQVAAYQCLQNLVLNAPDEAEAVLRSGFLTAVLTSLSLQNVPEKLLQEGVSLIAVISSQEMNARVVVESEAPEVIITVMRTKAEYRETMRQCLILLSKLSTNKEHASILAQKGAVVAVVETLLDRNDDAKFLTDVIRVMVNLAILEENAISLSETAMEPLIHCVDNHFASQPFIRMFYLLMGNLSMWPAASNHLIEQGMIPIIVDTMKASVNYPGLIVKMIKTLTNFTLVGEDAKRLLMKDGALLAVQEMMIVHRSHIQLVKAAEFFILKLSGNRRRGSALSAPIDLLTYVRQKIPEHLRNALNSGATFWKYGKKGAPKKRTVRVSMDFTKIHWDDPKKKSSPKSLPVRFLKAIVPGAATPQLREKSLFSSKRADPEASFSLFDVRDPAWALCLEANADDDSRSHKAAYREAQEWVTALQLLKDAYTDYSVSL